MPNAIYYGNERSVKSLRSKAKSIHQGFLNRCTEFMDEASPPNPWRLQPEEYSQKKAGWRVAPYDPTEMVSVFSRLRLRRGHRLAAYQYLDGMGSGNGMVFVIPEEKDLPELSNPAFSFGWKMTGQPDLSPGEAPLPKWVDVNVMKFMEGGDTPLAYLQASLFSREIGEVGAMWHGCYWDDHRILFNDETEGDEKWEWAWPRPKAWRPSVTMEPDQPVRVEFYTFTRVGRQQIVRHVDLYTDGLQAESETTTVSIGGPGIVY